MYVGQFPDATLHAYMRRVQHAGLAGDMIIYEQVQASKRTTARVVAHRELGIAHAFTMESSMCGKRGWHFSIDGSSLTTPPSADT